MITHTFVVRAQAAGGWSLRVKALHGDWKVSHAIATFTLKHDAEVHRDALKRALKEAY